MKRNLNEIDELVSLISKLPGLGKKSAKRLPIKPLAPVTKIVWSFIFFTSHS